MLKQKKISCLKLLCAIFLGWGIFAQAEKVTLPVYAELPDLIFIDQNLASQSIASTRGKVLLLNFFFTSCQGICPNIMGKLVRVQNKFAKEADLKQISLTVDPDRDTNDMLKAYEQKIKANQGINSWLFGRLDQDELIAFMRTGAKLAGDKDPKSHSTRVVLVDRRGRIRAYFNGLDPDVYDQIVPAVNQLLRD